MVYYITIATIIFQKDKDDENDLSKLRKGIQRENDLLHKLALVPDFLAQHEIAVSHDCSFSLYLPCREEFHNRVKLDFPVVAIRLSDYNAIREMLGYEKIRLAENEFTTQWQSIAT